MISRFYVLVLSFIVGLSLACNRKIVAYQNAVNTIIVQDSVSGDLLFDNDTISIYKIDSLTFFKEKKGAILSTDTLVYISDLEEARKMLKRRVVFGGYNTETGLIDSSINDGMIYKINFSNGKEVFANGQQYFWDMGFWKYYPTEDILLCEGGHSSDFSFDLTNGIIGADSVGNPEYISESPSGKYRLNGWFPGQECSAYFLQRKTEKGYRYFAFIPIHLTKEGFDFCIIKDEFWTDERTLYFRNFYYGSSDDNRLGFFRLVVKR